LVDIATGSHEFSSALKKAEHPMVIVGMGALARPDGTAIASLAAQIATRSGSNEWNGYCVLHTAASRVGALDVGFVPGRGGRDAREMAAPDALDLIFLLGADEIDVAPGAFTVYIGSHGENGARRADVILPGAAYPEKSAIYVNTEGRVQMAARASFPPGEAREDWAILRALSDVLGHRLSYDSLPQLRRALFKAYPHLQRIDQISPGARSEVAALAARGGTPAQAPFASAIEDYYFTNAIARCSAIMAECSAIAEGQGALRAAE
jgi:NADH-quinone oxidoreductase subunit G